MQRRWLPDGLLKRYKSAFIPSFYTPFAIQTPRNQQKRTWFTEGRPGVYLTDKKISAHLEGLYWVFLNKRVKSFIALGCHRRPRGRRLLQDKLANGGA